MKTIHSLKTAFAQAEAANRVAAKAALDDNGVKFNAKQAVADNTNPALRLEREINDQLLVAIERRANRD